LKALNNRYQTCGDTQRKTQMLLSYTVDVSRYYKCKQVIKRVSFSLQLWCTLGGCHEMVCGFVVCVIMSFIKPVLFPGISQHAFGFQGFREV